jgi:hypothetical protein
MRPTFWQDVDEACEGALLPVRTEFRMPSGGHSVGDSSALASIIDTETIPHWRTDILPWLSGPSYVVLIGSDQVVRFRSRIGMVVTARGFAEAASRIRLVVRKHLGRSGPTVIPPSARSEPVDPRPEPPKVRPSYTTLRLGDSILPLGDLQEQVTREHAATSTSPVSATNAAHNTAHSNERQATMSSINKALDDGMKVDGAIASAIADWKSGLTLGTAGGGERLNIEVAAAANCNVVKAKMSAMQTLGISGSITDILITLDDQIHIIRPLKKYPELFFYLAFDKAKGNLGLARHRIEAIEKELTL